MMPYVCIKYQNPLQAALFLKPLIYLFDANV